MNQSWYDIGPIYNPNGKILQLEYSAKAVNLGSTIVGIKYNNGILIARENPIEGRLYMQPTKIHTLQNVMFTGTGLDTDAIVIWYFVKQDVLNVLQNKSDDISSGMYMNIISETVHYPTKVFGARPYGCNMISTVKHNGYHLIGTTTDGKSNYYKAVAYGKGSQRAKTELEKLDLEDLDLEGAIDNAVRILYCSHDPLKDSQFGIEMVYMGTESNGEVVKVKPEELVTYVRRYEDLSIDAH